MGFGNFGAWESEFTASDGDTPSGAESRYIDGLPRPRAGLWHVLESYGSEKDGNESSLRYAQALQSYALMLPEDERLEELMHNQEAIDQRAGDLRGTRVHARLDGGAVTGDVGGYTILADSAELTLRLFELNTGGQLAAGIDRRTGRRLTGGMYLPVLAINGLTLIAKQAR